MKQRSIWFRFALTSAACALVFSARANEWRGSPTLSRIADKGTIHIGYIPTPGTFAYKDEQGQTVGYSIDLCWRVIEAIRGELKRPDIKPVFRPVEPSQSAAPIRTRSLARRKLISRTLFFRLGRGLRCEKARRLTAPSICGASAWR
jgi:ABC-type amino acid transport substrate-binding protein